jgi:hypothetical protein
MVAYTTLFKKNIIIYFEETLQSLHDLAKQVQEGSLYELNP